jgi:hypothetical protein
MRGKLFQEALAARSKAGRRKSRKAEKRKRKLAQRQAYDADPKWGDALAHRTPGSFESGKRR